MSGRAIRNGDTLGQVPDNSPAALLLVDVINDMEYRYALNQVRAVLKGDTTASDHLDFAALLRLARQA